MSGMKSWSTTAGNNVLANTGFTMDEGQAPSTLNDSIRQLMADVRTEWAQGASIASAATVDLSASTGGYVTVTGSTGPITSFGTVSAGIRRKLLFTGTPTITHNAASLISPTGGNIVVVAGDTCEVMSEGSGNWRILWYAGKTIQTTSITSGTTVSAGTGMAVGGASAGLGGIAFPATAVPITDVNTLDDYEEGTWVPNIGGTATYSTQTGTYTKIGRLVHITCSLGISSVGSGSTTLISGLPFAAAAQTSVAVGDSSNSATPVVSVTALVSGSSITVRSRTAASASDAANAFFANSAFIDIAGSYAI